MSDTDRLKDLADAALRGCAANVGPLIGVNLEIGEVGLEVSAELPDGPLAVLPVAVEMDGAAIGELWLLSPLEELPALARRMLDDPNADKIRELSPEERDAVGEVLNLMSGAIDAALRANLSEGVRARPLPWWRSDQPGKNKLPEGEFAVARASAQIQGAGSVGLWLRMPPRLLEEGSARQARRQLGRVLLLGIDAELRAQLEPLLTRAQVKVDIREPDDPELAQALESTQIAILSGDRGGALDLCRKLRLDNRTWRIPVVVCLKNPTRQSVLDAVDRGAMQVLAVPADEITVLRILQHAKSPANG